MFMLGRVIYWMLSGGNEYEDGGHRDAPCNLVGLLRSPRLEAVNELLDMMLPREPGKRLSSMAVAIESIDEAIFRMFGRGGDWCAVCGTAQMMNLGRTRTPGGTEILFDKDGQTRSVNQLHADALVCPKCGHLGSKATNTAILNDLPPDVKALLG